MALCPLDEMFPGNRLERLCDHGQMTFAEAKELLDLARGHGVEEAREKIKVATEKDRNDAG